MERRTIYCSLYLPLGSDSVFEDLRAPALLRRPTKLKSALIGSWKCNFLFMTKQTNQPTVYQLTDMMDHRIQFQ